MNQKQIKESHRMFVKRQLRSAKKMDQIQTVRDWIWDHADGDTELLNMCVIVEGTQCNNLTYGDWLDGMQLEKLASNQQTMITWNTSDYYVHVPDRLKDPDVCRRYAINLFNEIYSK